MRQLPLSAAPPQIRVLSVSELNLAIRSRLETSFRDVWVAGEISNYRPAPSGHCYFVLKDEQSQISAAMFRSVAVRVPFRPEDGLEVVVRGRVGLYEVRGALQLYVDALEPRGLGALQLAFEQLKQKLQAEGLFDPARKRPLPYFPRTIGIVTAGRGAAIHDMLVILRQRCPGLRIILRPTLVQGRDAPRDIVAALAELAEIAEIEVAIVGRGGGSIEDLWAFNDESVARAIAAAPFPVIAAVGHEVDFTIADFVADLRAPTPTAAAASVVPDRRELLRDLDQLTQALHGRVNARLQRSQTQLTALRQRLRDPRAALKQLQLRVDDLGERALRAVAANLRRAGDSVARHAEQLHALSPLAVLSRGYAIARREPGGTVVNDSSELRGGERLSILFQRGSALVSVDEVHAPTAPASES